jgi:hypothetical protein
LQLATAGNHHRLRANFALTGPLHELTEQPRIDLMERLVGNGDLTAGCLGWLFGGKEREDIDIHDCY